MSRLLEDYFLQILEDGLLTNKAVTFGSTLTVTGALTLSSTVALTSAATTNTIDITSTATTTGKAIDISDLNALTTGIGLHLASSATAITGAGRLLYSNHTGATGTSAILNEFASAATDETTVLRVTASAALAAGVILDLSGAAVTTGTILDMGGLDALTTGTGINLVSNSADTGTRVLVKVVNDNTAATGATVLELQQDADLAALKISGVTTTGIDFTGLGNTDRIFNATAATGSTAAPQTNAPAGFIKIAVAGTDQWVPYYGAT